MPKVQITDGEFQIFQKIIYDEIGIDLRNDKKQLVQGRLLKQMLKYNFTSYSEYLRLIQINWKEKIVMLNLITTNETFFFREIEHFEFCQKTILPQHPFKTKFRAWSAASSVGAEAYSLAMLLDTAFARSDWEVVGTDINTDVIEKANIALYPEAWLEKIPKELRKKYCLKGKGKHEGKFMIDKVLKENIHFFAKNLLMPISDIGKFDLIFLRNILIYFDEKTKQRVVDNIIFNLKPNGYLYISHTENLIKIDIRNLRQISGAIYQKRGTHDY
ncbi:MAG: chemotaxis protein CheR [Sulfurimonas sp.]|nr:MAG: chemotaxis protein CheR [Sulfurimonas sp.]